MHKRFMFSHACYIPWIFVVCGGERSHFKYGRWWWSSREAVKLVCTFSLVPLAPVESARSLPARSTRLILLTWNQTAQILSDRSTHTKIRHKGNFILHSGILCMWQSIFFPMVFKDLCLLGIEVYTYFWYSDIQMNQFDDSIKLIRKAFVNHLFH